MTPYQGSCLCGGIRYEFDGEPGPISLCHCAMCRKSSGSAYLAVAPIAAAAFRLVDGQALLRHYESSPGKQRGFCSRCGAPIYSRRADKPAVLRLRIGLLDTPLAQQPAFHIMVGSKADWETLPDDALPRHDGIEPGR